VPWQDKVADFLSLSEARRFVLRLLRQPGVYRFVTSLGDGGCRVPGVGRDWWKKTGTGRTSGIFWE